MTTPEPCVALLQRVGGDIQVFTELCDLFLEDAPRRLALIHKALLHQDAKALQQAAHAFKGAASAFDAADVVNAARRLEQQGASGQLADAEIVWRELESRSRLLIETLRAFRLAGEPCKS